MYVGNEIFEDYEVQLTCGEELRLISWLLLSVAALGDRGEGPRQPASQVLAFTYNINRNTFNQAKDFSELQDISSEHYKTQNSTQS